MKAVELALFQEDCWRNIPIALIDRGAERYRRFRQSSENVVNHRLQAASTGAEDRVYRFYSVVCIVKTCYREHSKAALA